MNISLNSSAFFFARREMDMRNTYEKRGGEREKEREGKERGGGEREGDGESGRVRVRQREKETELMMDQTDSLDLNEIENAL